MSMVQIMFAKEGLKERHQQYLEILVWDEPTELHSVFVKAQACELNQGVLNAKREPHPTPVFIYVDDCLIAEVRSRMERALLACIEAIFVVMGRPQPEVRQCPLAMDKWMDMRVSRKKIFLGLEFDLRQLTVGIPQAYLDEVQAIFDLH